MQQKEYYQNFMLKLSERANSKEVLENKVQEFNSELAKIIELHQKGATFEEIARVFALKIEKVQELLNKFNNELL
jgi:predicted HTH domain antitoxin